MAALTAARSTKQMEGGPLPRQHSFPVKGSTTIFQGSLVALNAGFAAPMAIATGRIAVGRAKRTVINAGADGAATVEVEPGVFVWGNSASGDLCAQADVGAVCYGIDDQTVAKTSNSSSRSVAGVIVQVDSDGVWVMTGLGINA
jgi:hypothetical protein